MRPLAALRSRLPLVACAACCALSWRLVQARPTRPDAEGVAELLGKAVDRTVEAGDFVWLPSRGWLDDALMGRRVLFAASAPGPEGPERDVFSAFVRVGREGRTISAWGARNLTDTPLADEGPIVAGAAGIAFAARWRGATSGVTVLPLAPERNWRGVLTFDPSPQEVRVGIGGGQLVVAGGEPDSFARLDLADGRWLTAGSSPAAGFLVPEPGRSPWQCLRRACARALQAARRALCRWCARRTGEVHQLEIDTDRYDLRLAAGYAEPHALTGPGSSGALPDRDARRAAVLLDAHGGGGMIAGGRVLVPPVAGDAIAIDRLGRARVGRWRYGDRVPESIAALRQAAPLTDEPGDDAELCLDGGRLIFAWGSNIARADLEAALPTCSARVLLTASVPVVRALDPGQAPSPNPRDFLYLVRRDPAPPGSGPLRFSPDGGRQPGPAEIPAVYRAEEQRDGSRVAVWAVAADRFEWRLAAASADIRGRTAGASLAAADRDRVLIAIGLGASDPANRRGFYSGGALFAPFREGHGALLAGRDVELALSVAGMAGAPVSTTAPERADAAADADAAELVLLAEAGELRSEARAIGAFRPRAALCAESGWLYAAEAVLDNPAPIAAALLELGCRRVVDTDRGRQVAAFVDRADTDHSPRTDYRDAVLLGLHAAHPRRAGAL